MDKHEAIEEVDGFYRVLPLRSMRRTPGVAFDVMFDDMIPKVDAVDRVLHAHGAVSPGPVGEVERPWYMHPCQADNLLVLHGTRYVDIYTHELGELVTFEATADYVKKNGALLHDGPAILVWPRGVFHRVVSDPEVGSASVNLATHYEGFDIETNFSVYDVNTMARTHRMIRSGVLDQM